MRTRSQARKRRQQQVRQTSVEPPNLEKPNNNQELFNPPIVTMADNRTMAQLLEEPTEGYEDAIVVPKITANNFEIKHGLLNLVQNKQFFGHDKEDPHAHIRYFNKITSTMKFPNVPSTSVKLMLFPFSLEGAARIWLEKEPPRSILTWDDLVSKFINKFFPPSKTTNLRNEITRFQQKFDETFYEAWDRFNDLLRGCPHHGFSELHQLDTFYNALNSNDQDSLNSAAGGNFLDKMPRECLKIIESKSKVRQSRSKAIVSKVSTSSSTPAVSSDIAELKDMVRALILDKKNQTPAPAPVKAVEQSCVTCGGGHSYQNCPATDGNIYRDNIQEYVSQAAAVNYNQGNASYRPQMVANQIRPPDFVLVVCEAFVGIFGKAKQRSSRQNKSPVIHAQDDTPAMQPLDLKDEYIRTRLNLEGAGLERLKQQYQNDVELEYHVDQLKATMLTEAKWNSDEDEVSKPRTFERHMSKNTKPHPFFYNNDFYYLVCLSTKEKYTTSITKHYAARFYKQGIEDIISDRWSKETHRYIFEAFNGIHHWEDDIIDFFKAEMSTRTEGSLGDSMIKSVNLAMQIFLDSAYTISRFGNLLDMVKKNKLGTGNKRLKGRDRTDMDVEKLNKMVDKIEKTLKRRKQLKRLEEYVRGRLTRQ
ncbi:reverse transcriptase domain-containing protein [Tanacetum coccineum]